MPRHCRCSSIAEHLCAKDLPMVPTWRLERDLNLRPSGCKAPNQALSHHHYFRTCFHFIFQYIIGYNNISRPPRPSIPKSRGSLPQVPRIDATAWLEMQVTTRNVPSC